MSFNNLDQLYRNVIMDHYKNPRNKGSLENGNLTIDMNNPTCGDRIHLTMNVEDGKVTDAKFRRRRLFHFNGFRFHDDRND